MAPTHAERSRPLVQTLLFPLAARFVAGDSISAAISAVRRLNAEGLSATIDVLGEDVKSGSDANLTCHSYFALIDRMQSASVSSNISLKLSALGLAFDDGRTLERLLAVLERAKGLSDPFVRVDMEGSAFVSRTLETVKAAFLTHRNTGPVLQAYLHRTLADAAAVVELGMRVRLCKGAYREPRAVAVSKMAAIRHNYLECAKLLLKRGTLPAFATHDPLLIAEVRRLANELGVPKESFEFQLLYGVRPDLQRLLAQDGYSVRVYVPFGSHWAKYLRRRIMERRENAVFALRSALGAAK
jgi:proline dehydrogenase